MSLYPSDGDIAFGWRSFGRSFAIFGVLAAVAAVLGFSLLHGKQTATLEPATQVFAWTMQWTGAGLFTVLAAAACGSILISRRERGGVEITSDGVRRILAPGKEEFLEMESIEGLMGRPQGGVLLIDRTGRRDMIIPRSIESYRDCIAELKAMGVKSLPADRRRIWGQRKRTFSQNVAFYAMCVFGSLYGSRNMPLTIHHILGLTLVVSFQVYVIMESRRLGRFQWGPCLIGTLGLGALLWWRW